MDRYVKFAEGKSFSRDDIKRLCENKARVIEYGELAKYRSIDSAIGPHGALVVLYETRESYGHWCAIMRVDELTLEFFDPYGFPMDRELQMINPYFREVSGQDRPHLSYLVAHSQYDLIQNGRPLQRFAKDTNTCGRWVGLRIALRRLPLKQFIRLFVKQKFPPDWYVTALTLFV